MIGFLKPLAKILSVRAFKSSERKGRIDDHSAVFQIGPSDWRYVENDRRVDFYADCWARKIDVDRDSLEEWRLGKYEPFDGEQLLKDSLPTGVLTESERGEILNKMEWFFVNRLGFQFRTYSDRG